MTDTPSTILLTPDAQRRLEPWLAGTIAAARVTVTAAAKLAGGAVQENWRIDVAVEGGPRAGRQAWVLRTDAPAQLSMSLDRAREYACIRAAHAAGVLVGEPIGRTDDKALIGRPFLIQAFVTGTAQGRRIVRDSALAEFGPPLAREIGRQMARLHTIRPPNADLGFLPIPAVAPARIAVGDMRRMLDEGTQPRPALEYVLRWLDANAPQPRVVTLVHGDLRTGNYMIDGGRLTGILDWEFCHWGDPREDLGWFCARCWRFGNDDREAGGIATKADLLAGYNSAADAKVAADEIAYWEVLAAARWAAIAALQGDRFLKGGEQSLELALTGLMPAEMELDALQLIAKLEG